MFQQWLGSERHISSVRRQKHRRPSGRSVFNDDSDFTGVMDELRQTASYITGFHSPKGVMIAAHLSWRHKHRRNVPWRFRNATFSIWCCQAKAVLVNLWV